MDELAEEEERKLKIEAARDEEIFRLQQELEAKQARLDLTESSHSVIEQMISTGVLSKRKDGHYDLTHS